MRCSTGWVFRRRSARGLHTPAGLEIGAKTPGEIALSIMAGVVRAIRKEGLGEAAHKTTPRQEVDPLCGMTVVVGPDTPHREVDGVLHWFCSTACRDQWAPA